MVDNMHVLSINQYSQDDLLALFKKADEFQKLDHDESSRRDLANLYHGRQLCSLFYEPSTRTRLSFETAAVKLGMSVVSTENAREFSSAAKGETIEDTVRVLDGYHYDAIVLRHHETGAAKRAADVSKTPIINAGDGKGEHPTQALLDLYTIYQKHGRLDNLTVVIGGDLANGRTARSLALALSKFEKNEIIFVSVPELQIGNDIKQALDESGTRHTESSDVAKAVQSADVVYWTRLQKERLDKDVQIANNFVITADIVSQMPSSAIIMHPLPRVDEITTEVDHDERAGYFKQAANGLYIRMALLSKILN